MNTGTAEQADDADSAGGTPTGAQEPVASKRTRWTANWAELAEEVVLPGICTGCSGCIVACPKDVLAITPDWNPSLDPSAWFEEGSARCTHGERGCTLCARACPRLRAWEPQADTRLHGRSRDPNSPSEVAGMYRSLLLTHATDPQVTRAGQDGGFVSALLIHCLEQGHIDAALVSYVDDQWNTQHGVAWNREDVLRATGSRYTYSANLAAYDEAVDGGAERIALVGMGCQTSVAPIMMERGVRKAGRRIVLNIGLLCSKTFSEELLDELLGTTYGIARSDVLHMDVKGVLQLTLREGINEDNYLEIPLKECHPFTRSGCATCPDFSAEHADISTGGIGSFANRTLTVVRTEYGEQLVNELIDANTITATDATEEDPRSVKLLSILSKGSRKRWPLSEADGVPLDHAIPGHLPPP